MTKKMLIIMAFAGIIVIGTSLPAFSQQAGAGNGAGKTNMIQKKSFLKYRFRFQDENCDGINDNYRDHDGDGIPNGLDPDWVAPQDGTGYKNRNNNQNGGQGTMTSQTSGASFCRGSAALTKSAFRSNMRQNAAGTCRTASKSTSGRSRGRR